MIQRVRLIRDGALYAVLCADSGLWLAGLLSASNRAAYVARWGWEVVAE